MNERSKPQGRAHRAKLRRWMAPRLCVGWRVPSSAWLGMFLGISPAEGYRHMQIVLHEDGVATETRGVGVSRRIYVISTSSLLSPLSPLYLPCLSVRRAISLPQSAEETA